MKPWWQVLDVPRGSDRATIRRAYAARLKVTNPEDEPQGFMALRQAYEAALSWVDHSHWEEDEADEGALADAFRLDVPAPAPESVPPFVAESLDDPPSVPEPEPEPPEHAADRADLRRRADALEAALRGPWRRDGAALEGLLDDLLAAPALMELDTRDSVEYWLAGLLADTLPRSDAILMQAISAFGWEGESHRSHAVWQIRGRIDEWRVIQLMERGSHPLGIGWRALTRRNQPPWQRRLGALRPEVASRVQGVLDLAQYQMPGLAFSFDAVAAEWWREHLSRPRFGFTDLAVILVGMVGAIVFAMLDTSPAVRIAGGAGCALAGLAFPLLRLRLIAPWRQRREEEGENGGWIDWGWTIPWLLAALGLIFLPVGQPVTIATAVLCGVAVSWMAATVGCEPLVGNPIAPMLALAGLGIVGAAGFIALPGAAQLGLIVFAVASILVTVSGRDALAALLWRINRFPVFTAGGAALLLLAAALLRQNLPGAPAPLVHWGAAAIAGMVCCAAARDIADRTPAVPMLPWLRWGLWLALVFAAIASIPDVPKAPPPVPQLVPADETADAFAALEKGNPGLHSAIELIRQQRVHRKIKGDEAVREIDRLIHRAYIERLPRASATLVAREFDIQLQQLRELQMFDATICAGISDRPAGDRFSGSLKRRYRRHVVEIAGSTAVDQQELRAGRAIPMRDLIDTAAANRAEAARITAAIEGNEPKSRCAARIAVLEALVALPDMDIARTMRPALEAQAAKSSETEKRDQAP